MRSSIKPSNRRDEAFTLIEVTIALGLVAIALVAMLGMLPQGMSALKRATDLAVETRIHQQLVAEVSSAHWSDREKYDKALRYFDDQGVELEESDAERSIYTARMIVPKAADTVPARFSSDGADAIHVPFDSSGGGDEDKLQLILVEITSAQNRASPTGVWTQSSDFDNPDNFPSIHTFQGSLTRMSDLETSATK